MKLGYRSKLFFLSLALIGVASLASSLVIERNLRLAITSRIEDELHRHAHVTRDLVELVPGPHDIATMDSLANRLGESIAARVSIIDMGGTLLGDSELTVSELGEVESHGDRPEVVAAKGGEFGVARRRSSTLGTDMLYVAVPYSRTDGRGVARVAMPLVEVDNAVEQLRLLLIISVLCGIAAAAVLSGVASHLMSRTLRRVVESARALAEGRGSARIHVASGDELGGLAGSLNRLSSQIEGVVGSLAQERNRFEAVLEGLGEGVLALDEDQHVTHANGIAAKMLGCTREIAGRKLIDVVRVPALHELVSNVSAGESNTTQFAFYGSKDRFIQATATLQRGAGGVVIVLHDVTELRRLERVRRDFIANLSHEIRTPVGIIRANAETLLAGALEDPKHAREFVEGLARHSERLSTLIADLLDLSRIESGRYPIEIESVDLQRAVANTVEGLRRMADTNGVTLESTVDEGLLVCVDSAALEQILFNLVENALKYTPSGGSVELRTTGNEHCVRLEVRDDGPGIDRKHRERIFERFYRVDAGRSRQMGGTGLGLSIVKNLTESMGAQCGVEPRPEGGAVFWVLLSRSGHSEQPQDSSEDHE